MDLQGKEKAVVVENGTTVVSVHASEKQALDEAQRRKKLAESAGTGAPAVTVKQTLLG